MSDDEHEDAHESYTERENPVWHRARHVQLHEALDELLVDYMRHGGKLPSQATVWDLLDWSAGQLIVATPTSEGRPTLMPPPPPPPRSIVIHFKHEGMQVEAVIELGPAEIRGMRLAEISELEALRAENLRLREQLALTPEQELRCTCLDGRRALERLRSAATCPVHAAHRPAR